MVEIIGIMLVRNEDIFIGQAIVNVLDFCDKLIVADHLSIDRTAAIVNGMKSISSKIVYLKIKKSGESHDLIKHYAGTKTWVLGIDGDEIYDPIGLAALKIRLETGEYDETWQIFGNVLHCTALDLENKIATGYLSPPSRSMTKLYNFNAIESWEGECNEPFLGGAIIFRNNFNSCMRLSLHTNFSWDNSFFRCLHTCFLRRSSLDKIAGNGVYLRPNPVENANRSPRDYLFAVFAWLFRRPQFISKWKRDKYMQGTKVTTGVDPFFDRRAPR